MSVDIYGIDTETYTVGGTGLLSIQIYGDGVEKYIAVDDEIIDFDDEEIREILLDELIFFFDEFKRIADKKFKICSSDIKKSNCNKEHEDDE